MTTKTKKTLLFWGLFIVIFGALLTVATLFDKQISDILAKPYLENGNYFSTNVFARIFEVVGEMPLYLFVIIASAIIIFSFISDSFSGIFEGIKNIMRETDIELEYVNIILKITGIAYLCEYTGGGSC